MQNLSDGGEGGPVGGGVCQVVQLENSPLPQALVVFVAVVVVVVFVVVTVVVVVGIVFTERLFVVFHFVGLALDVAPLPHLCGSTLVRSSPVKGKLEQIQERMIFNQVSIIWTE